MLVRKLLLSLLILLLLLSTAQAERVLNPYDYEFKNKWYLTVVYGEPSTQADTNLRQLMGTDLRWRALQSRVIFTEWEAGALWMRQSAWGYFLSTGKKPAIILQSPHRADGKAPVVFYGTADTVKFDATLFDRMSVVASRYIETYPDRAAEQCPFTPRPKTPAPTIPAQPPATPAPLVPTPAPATPVEENYIPLLFFLLPFAGAALGVRAYLKEGR